MGDPVLRPPLPTVELVVDVGDEEVEQFRQQGFTWVPRITTDEELEWLDSVYDHLFEQKLAGVPGGYFDLSRPYDAPGEDHLPQVLFPDQVVPELRDTVYYRNARRIIARLLGEDEADLTGWSHMIDKPPFHGHETPWHQDESYWEPALTYQAAGAWMPLEDVDTENGCMTFLPGSHRSEVLPHKHISDDPAVHGLELAVEIDTSSAVPVPLRAGGATFHHPRMIHSTGPNRSPRRRRAWANEFQTAPVTAEVEPERPWLHEGRAAWKARFPEADD
jgi:hypothetical protein